MIFLVLQRQTYMAAPVLLAGYWIAKDKERTQYGWAVLGGAAASLILLAVLPKSPLQSQMTGWALETWMAMPWVFVFKQVFAYSLQFPLALGLFLMGDSRLFILKYPARTVLYLCSGVVFLTILFTWLNVKPLSAGVFFTDYFPPVLGNAFLAMGLWGLWGLKSRVRSWPRSEVVRLYFLIVGFLGYTGFAVFTGSSDVKYMIPWAAVLFFYWLKNAPSDQAVSSGRRVLFFVFFAAAIFFNRINLDMTTLRWQLAYRVASDVDLHQRPIVSGGYGFDIFYYGNRCAARFDLSDPGQRVHFFSTTPRQYERGWQPRFMIKPLRIGIKDISFRPFWTDRRKWILREEKGNSVFGVPIRMGVFESEEYLPAPCS